ncbi:unnamed protein product [Peronospora belbahrii]|uniref:Uncharacterized protein n=1 Tax=Peronospora belbahrii TaxID=622444 RepID=A0AAU9LAL4_9STRA|nr:unnamed protein product [Peronospora belbahrii]
MTRRSRDGDSVGRLLRVLGDCELFHIETAIRGIGRAKAGIRSESIQSLSVKDNVNIVECTAEGRVLSLSDHKSIAQVQAVLNVVVNAYTAKCKEEEEGGGAERTETNRNLVCAIAGAAMTQSLRDCVSSRTNCCIWGQQAEKLNAVLDWMIGYERDIALPSRDYVRQLLLQWIQPSVEKQNQFAACLTLFELLQRRRRKLQTCASNTDIACLLGNRAGMYLNALSVVVERGTIRVADSHHVKPSKLALVALEALALLCGDVAAQYMTSNKIAKRRFVDEGLACKMVECMRFILIMLRRWHLHSARRQFLGYALQHLQSYVTPCRVILSSTKEVGSEHARCTILNDTGALDALCWHWQTTVPLLCTRTDSSCRIQATRSPEVLTSVLDEWAFSAIPPKAIHGSNHTVVNPEVIYAQLRYVCVLMDSIGGMKGCSKAFGDLPDEFKAYFIFFFIQGLSMAIKNESEETVLLILKVMRAVLLPNDTYVVNLFDSQDTEQELLAQLLRLHGNFAVAHEISDSVSQAQAELEFFVADFVISRDLFITEVIRRVQEAYTHSQTNILSLVRTFLYQLDNASIQTQLHRHWRQMLTSEVVRHVAHENRGIRQFAISCLPSLDMVSYIAGLCTLDTYGAGTHIITSVLGYLFTASPQCSVEVGVSWLIDAYQFGTLRVPVLESLASSHNSNDYARKLRDDVKQNIAGGGDERQKIQEKVFSLCFGPNGWAKLVQSYHTRSEVLQVLLRKIFGFPRDAVLLRMLREFVVCGWVDNEVFEVLGKQLTAQIMSLPRLSEEILNDSSVSAVKSCEGLLFSRLVPLLVLRMLPRHALATNDIESLLCGREDLDHLDEYVNCQLELDSIDSEATSKGSMGSTIKTLFHIIGRSVVDPLEFKEVKMVATECLSKFSPPRVLPFVFAYLAAFLREATPHGKYGSSYIVEEDSIPSMCGLVTAKLMVYYLNRVFSEYDYAYKDEETVLKALVVLVQIMEVPCVQDSRLSSDDSGQRSTNVPVLSASSLMTLLMGWIFGKVGKGSVIDCDTDPFISRVQELLDNRWSGRCHHKLPSQVRICCCNVLLSAISRAESRVLASWKMQGFMLQIARATDSCSEDDVVAGGLQIIFSLLHKSSEHFSMDNTGDLQLVRVCFETTAARLETTGCESVAMNGLKVAGALVGKYLGFMSPVELQRLIDKCLIKVRDRQISPVVRELAQSLLQAMAPP